MTPATSKSAADDAQRSALCVPIRVRGRIVNCLYVTNNQIRDLFGEDEERLADFIATIAGAALENADGFAELQELNASLERRVVERTAAAESRAQELAASNQELQRIARIAPGRNAIVGGQAGGRKARTKPKAGSWRP